LQPAVFSEILFFQRILVFPKQ